MDYQIEDIKSCVRLLKGEKNFFFTNHGIKHFWNLINSYPDFKEFTDQLLEDHEVGKIIEETFSKNDYHGTIHTFLTNNQEPQRYYNLCAALIKKVASTAFGNQIYYSALDNVPSRDQSSEFEISKAAFIATYIKPLSDYLERKRILNDSRVDLAKRYRILCTTYDLENIKGKEELELTEKHLARFLFTEGIDYVFTETNVHSGRIDVFSENKKIVIEGKIYKGGNFPDCYKAVSQTLARLQDLNMDTGYVFIYNQSEKAINIETLDGYTNNEPYWILDGKKIYLIIINLNEELIKPKEQWAASIKIVNFCKNKYQEME